jgi:hypothetical protein
LLADSIQHLARECPLSVFVRDMSVTPL